MRVAVMTAGSRGDIAPCTGLAHGLSRAGHHVTVATHASFAPLVEAAGVRMCPLPVDPRAELESDRGRALHHSTTEAGRILRLVSMARALVGDMAPPLAALARDSDALVLSSWLAPLGHALGEALEVPSIGAFLQPLHPTRAFAPSVLGARSYGPWGNRLAGQLANVAVDRVFADAVRTTLRDLPGTAPGTARRAGHRMRERRRRPVQHGFSPAVVPRPHDWRPGLEVSGYWWPHDPAGARLPRHVEKFLADGAPPVFVGLGSATVPAPEETSGTVVRALRAAGLRGVVQRGWAGLRADDGNDLLTVDEVPQSLLFPRMAAVVHHCGAGTTGAGLRAGVPVVPVPVQFDAAFWAARLVELGVAPCVVPLRQVTAGRLAAALSAAVRAPSYARHARGVCARVRAEDGTGAMVAALDRLTGRRP